MPNPPHPIPQPISLLPISPAVPPVRPPFIPIGVTIGSGAWVHQPITGVLSGAGAEAQAVKNQLNVGLKSALISAATDGGNSALADVLNTLGPADARRSPVVRRANA